MALYDDVGARIKRDGSYLSMASNWSVSFWYKTNSNTGPADIKVAWALGDYINGVNPYISITNFFDSYPFYLEVFDGANYTDSLTFVATLGQWYYFELTYNSTTHTLSFYVDGVLVGAIVSNLNAIVFVEKNELFITGLGPSNHDHAGSHLIIYQRILTNTEFNIQKISPIVVSTTSILAFNSCLTEDNLEDQSLNSRLFTVDTGAYTNTATVASVVNKNSPAYAVVADISTYYIKAQDINDNGTDATYPSSCSGTGFHSSWYKFTTNNAQRLVSISVDILNGGGNITPYVSIWTGGPLTQYTIQLQGSTQDFCGNLSGGDFWFEVPVSPSTTYYLQIETLENITPDTSIIVEIRPAPLTYPVLVGSIIIPDDDLGFPAIVLATNGTFLQPLNLPPGEYGDTLADGTIAVQDDTSSAQETIRLYTKDGALITSFSYTPGIFLRGLKSDRNATFYIMTLSGATIRVQTCDNVGNLGALHNLPANATNNTNCFAVNRTGTRLYYGRVAFANDPIHVWDLVNNIALADLTAGFVGERLAGIGDGMTDSAGNILFGYYSGVNPVNTYKIRRFSPAGALLNTYILINAAAPLPDHFFWGGDTVDTFWFWQFETASQALARLRQVRIADGVILQNFTFPVASTSGEPASGPLAISNSCPGFVTTQAITLAGLGTIIVQKVTTFTDLAETFDMFSPNSASPSSLVLSPSNWTLANGEFQIFPNLSPGTYSLEETIPVGWSPIYNVSNGGDITAISVAAGETVIVTIYNNKVGSGIYYLLKNKMHDTLYTALIPSPTTLDVKIP